MHDTPDPNQIPPTIESLLRHIEMLEMKVLRLEERLNHDHEDLERLQEVAMHDHEDLEQLKGSSHTRSRSYSTYSGRPMVGL